MKLVSNSFAVYLNMPTRTIYLLESNHFASSGNTFLIIFVFHAALTVSEWQIYSYFRRNETDCHRYMCLNDERVFFFLQIK